MSAGETSDFEYGRCGKGGGAFPDFAEIAPDVTVGSPFLKKKGEANARLEMRMCIFAAALILWEHRSHKVQSRFRVRTYICSFGCMGASSERVAIQL